ncbi:MAG TPA: outer membrane beta-barrel family protein [Sphingobacteriaceae bacterium]
MKKFILRALVLFFSFIYVSAYVNNVSAQTITTFSIRGKVVDNTAAGAPGVNVQLFTVKDSALVKVEVTNGEGKFLFDKVPAGEYRIATSYIGFTPYSSGRLSLSQDTDLGTITLKESATMLKEVAVVSTKPLIEQHFDKMVLNVEGSISSVGSTALEVLEKAPGIAIDQNDNISMRGRQGVIVMVDGKRVPMSGSELATMLRGLSANSVEKIDLITNPSSKYDASGNSGIIDIRLKKDKRNGTNGNVSLSLGHGRYMKANEGLTLNHRNKNVNVFGSYNYVNRKEFNELDINRKFYSQNVFTGAYEQDNNFDFKFNSHNVRLGMDYYISPKTIIGVVTNGSFFGIDRNTRNTSDVISDQNVKSSTFNTDGFSHANRNNGNININFKHTLDNSGKEITADLDYARFYNSDRQNYNTRYLDLQNNPTRSPYVLFGDLDGTLDIKSAKIDYSQKLKNGVALELGVKSSLVSTDNDLAFFDRSGGGNVFDSSKSNHFLYDENINAAYVNANKRWSKTGLQLGLRLENTNAKGLQLSNGEKFDNSYTQLFPSATFSYKPNKIHDLAISVSRRINRPTYNQLNPFKYFLDPSTFASGNPFLKPELTYSFELTHTINQKFIAKYSYSQTTDNMLSVLSPAEGETNVIIQTDRNLAKFDYYGMTFTTPFSVGNWFNSVNNTTLYYGLYRGNLANTSLSSGRPTVNFNTNNTFVLAPTWTAEVVGTYRAREVYGFLVVKPITFVSAGIQRQLWNKKASVKLNVSDIFYTQKVNGSTVLTGYQENFFQQRDARVATLNFTYRFGKNQNGPSRRNTGGAEEEKRRAN